MGVLTGLARPERAECVAVLAPGFYSDYPTDLGSQLGSAINRFSIGTECVVSVQMGAAYSVQIPPGRYSGIEEVADTLAAALNAVVGSGWRVLHSKKKSNGFH